LSDLFSDLENLGYRAGGADLCAAGVGAPHIRQRLWWVADSCIKQRSQPPDSQCCEKDERSTNGGVADTLVNTVRLGSQTSNDVACRQQSVEHKPGLEPGVPMGITHSNGSQSGDRSTTTTRQRHPFITASDWSDHDIITCYDGKARFVEPGLAPLADGIPARVGRLRGYGNAIVPQVAAQFIKAYANG
jgi:DNA (cytosine-5)-methyltransferase 1